MMGEHGSVVGAGGGGQVPGGGGQVPVTEDQEKITDKINILTVIGVDLKEQRMEEYRNMNHEPKRRRQEWSREKAALNILFLTSSSVSYVGRRRRECV